MSGPTPATGLAMKRSEWMRRGMLCLFIACPLAACSEVRLETYCFKMDGGRDVRLEFHTYFDTASEVTFGSVRYGHSKKGIPLVLAGAHADTSSKAANPVSSTSWIEFVDGRVNGTYEFSSQGGQIFDLTYTSKAGGKKTSFVFEPNAEVSTEGVCTWPH